MKRLCCSPLGCGEEGGAIPEISVGCKEPAREACLFFFLVFVSDLLDLSSLSLFTREDSNAEFGCAIGVELCSRWGRG